MSKARVLIVDDMPEIRMLIRRILTNAGIESIEADSGRKAIELIENEDFELVLLDIVLPDLDGYTVMEAITDLKEEKGFKVCFMSGKKEKDAVLKAIDAGGDDYIVKPIFPENLMSKIGILLKRIDLIQGFNLLKCKIRAELLYLDITPDVQIRGIDELSLSLYSTADIKPETQLHLVSKKLNQVLGFEGEFTLKVNKCRRDSFGKYSVRARFVGLSESIATEIRALAIKGQFIAD